MRFQTKWLRIPSVFLDVLFEFGENALEKAGVFSFSQVLHFLMLRNAVFLIFVDGNWWVLRCRLHQVHACKSFIALGLFFSLSLDRLERQCLGKIFHLGFVFSISLSDWSVITWLIKPVPMLFKKVFWIICFLALLTRVMDLTLILYVVLPAVISENSPSGLAHRVDSWDRDDMSQEMLIPISKSKIYSLLSRESIIDNYTINLITS